LFLMSIRHLSILSRTSTQNEHAYSKVQNGGFSESTQYFRESRSFSKQKKSNTATVYSPHPGHERLLHTLGYLSPGLEDSKIPGLAMWSFQTLHPLRAFLRDHTCTQQHPFSWMHISKRSLIRTFCFGNDQLSQKYWAGSENPPFLAGWDYRFPIVTDAIVRGFMVLRTGFSRKIAREVVLAGPHDVRKDVAFQLVEIFTDESIQMERNWNEVECPEILIVGKIEFFFLIGRDWEQITFWHADTHSNRGQKSAAALLPRYRTWFRPFVCRANEEAFVRQTNFLKLVSFFCVCNFLTS
jgi:hypothetical protein